MKTFTTEDEQTNKTLYLLYHLHDMRNKDNMKIYKPGFLRFGPEWDELSW